jgi:hypothetical protein
LLLKDLRRNACWLMELLTRGARQLASRRPKLRLSRLELEPRRLQLVARALELGTARIGDASHLVYGCSLLLLLLPRALRISLRGAHRILRALEAALQRLAALLGHCGTPAQPFAF